MGSKRSIRCKKCEHNLLKPEYSPTSIKFKIHLCASSFIPDVRIFSLPDWSRAGPHKGYSLLTSYAQRHQLKYSYRFFFVNYIIVSYSDLPFVLTVTNPSHSNMTITLLPYCHISEELTTEKNIPKLCGKIIFKNESHDVPGKFYTFFSVGCSFSSFT